ncbi:MAG: protein translocase SEC61 complex subunit gamma [Candidatus Aenigmarchaeota archaeon]|nr:protein translocase SEC61 complex subunit gamma [Candidatus Aenigmarchaeota archaeon]MCX8179436.1 protein translocase SEC61 complex subunit gamma [Candidatus Aenigmarchaeota archaeon]
MKIKEVIKRYVNILVIARKPTKKELKNVLRTVFYGFIAIGLIGFIFYMISVIAGG